MLIDYMHTMKMVKQRAIHETWQAFINNEPFDKNIIAPYILRGWQVSQKMKVDPISPTAPPVLSIKQLSKLENYHDLLAAAKPMLDLLSVSIHETGYIANLALSSGHLIAVVGDDILMDKAKEMYNIPGALRSVEAVGSSAVWICLEEKKPVQITGFEHYCQTLHDWKCAAAPIFDDNQNTIGALVISSHISQKDIHTLTLAKSCADGISIRLRENKLLHSQKRLNAVLQSSLDALPELVITLNEENIITHANCNNSAFVANNNTSIVGDTVHVVFSEDAIVKARQIMQQTIIQTHELRVKTPFGYQNKLCRFIPICLGNGKFGGTIISITSKSQIIDIAKHVSGNYAKYTFADIKGQNSALVKQIELAKLAAAAQSRILLTGESGTGKELFAQAIHNSSTVANDPFVAISCAAIPRDLIESELFGYVGGAFTGARKNGMIGKMELASGGTLFLDEINSLPLEMQAKLLRALQQKEIVRIGDTKPTPIDIRVISASNVDLKQSIQQGIFRGDLYYRLNVVEIVIPALRDRKDDLELLINLILRRQCLGIGLPFPRISTEALQALYEYSWPGNIRELDNACERALLISRGELIEIEHLPAHIMDSLPNFRVKKGDQIAIVPKNGSVTQAYIDVITEALTQYNGNLSQASKHLGIARTTLYRKIKKLNII